MNKEKILKAGKILSEVREYSRKFIKKDMPLLEIAEKIEEKIFELDGKIAFPTGLSINNIAAHYTPGHDDKTLANGLLKVDIGVHVDGWIADTAFSIDLENNEENKKLIEASEKAIENVIKEIKKDIQIREIGKTVQETIESYGFSPIINLSGHQVEEYELHAGISIPNFDNRNNQQLPNGLYAIEPFATSGNGKIYDGKPSGIYRLIDEKNVRNPLARQILELIKKEYSTLPFCSRWIVKKFGTKALIGLKQLEENNNLHNYAVLVETSHKNVAQTEHTILVEDNEIIVTTK
jgi:methionyl aminopeptidase|tara:strand:+ start:903 stop:1781 length:879 start_codon:yes stop_codon:yes gene_type:complete